MEQLDLKSSGQAQWSGRITETPLSKGFTELTRSLTLELDPITTPGDKSCSVQVMKIDESVAQLDFLYHVLPAIKTTPKGLYIARDGKEVTLLLSSEDDERFQVVKIECDSQMLAAIEVDNTGSPARKHVVSVRRRHNDGPRIETKLRVITTHSKQAEVVIPVYLQPE